MHVDYKKIKNFLISICSVFSNGFRIKKPSVSRSNNTQSQYEQNGQIKNGLFHPFMFIRHSHGNDHSNNERNKKSEKFRQFVLMIVLVGLLSLLVASFFTIDRYQTAYIELDADKQHSETTRLSQRIERNIVSISGVDMAMNNHVSHTLLKQAFRTSIEQDKPATLRSVYVFDNKKDIVATHNPIESHEKVAISLMSDMLNKSSHTSKIIDNSGQRFTMTHTIIGLDKHLFMVTSHYDILSFIHSHSVDIIVIGCIVLSVLCLGVFIVKRRVTVKNYRSDTLEPTQEFWHEMASKKNVFKIDLRRGVITFVPSIIEMLGFVKPYTQSSLAGFLNKIHKDDVDRVSHLLFSTVLQDHDVKQEVIRIEHENGHYITVSLSLTFHNKHDMTLSGVLEKTEQEEFLKKDISAYVEDPILDNCDSASVNVSSMVNNMVPSLEEDIYEHSQYVNDPQHYEKQSHRADNSDYSDKPITEMLEMVRNLGHEVRNPLNTIVGYAQMMKEQMLGPLGHDDYSQYAYSIEQSANDMIDMFVVLSELIRLQQTDIEEANVFGSTNVSAIVKDIVHNDHAFYEKRHVVVNDDCVIKTRPIRTMRELLEKILRYMIRGMCYKLSKDSELHIKIEEKESGIAIKFMISGEFVEEVSSENNLFFKCGILCISRLQGTFVADIGGREYIVFLPDMMQRYENKRGA